MFSARGYNIDSLTVAQVETDENLSRITVTTSATNRIMEQIKAQLERLVPVHKVLDLGMQGTFVSRELVFAKVKCKGEKKSRGIKNCRYF